MTNLSVALLIIIIFSFSKRDLDNIWLKKGQLAKNYQLVEKAVNVIETAGSKVMSPKEVRETLRLKKQ